MHDRSTGARLAQRLFTSVLRHILEFGSLTVIWPNQEVLQLGNGQGPAAGFKLLGPRVVQRLALNPAMALGEAYMDGTLQPIDCTIYDILDLLMLNLDAAPPHPVMRAWNGLSRLGRRWRDRNTRHASVRNVAHHYDLNTELYRQFLDPDLQYSCAYFTTGDESLAQAQIAKKRHIAAKLYFDKPDLTVLDIGCGWGGLALTLAREHGAHVTGITLSHEQLNIARARARDAGLANRVRFELADYREQTGVFDRVVSVGMLEHVGRTNYPAFFAMVRRCLAPDGVALVHTVGRSEGPGDTAPWLQKYIFPGGYSPALGEVLPAVERSGLTLTDIEVMRLHYARTIRLWRERFDHNRGIIAALYDDRLCRMFEFYLAGVELAFRRQGHVNFQLQLAPAPAILPLIRDYMVTDELACLET